MPRAALPSRPRPGSVAAMTKLVVNFLAFQIGWFMVILGAAAGYPWVGPVYMMTWLALHIWALGETWSIEAKLIGIGALLGYAADSALVLGGWLSFPSYAQLGGPSPLWMVSLWMGFAATLCHALGWLGGRYWLAALLGAMFGPLAYWGGASLGAVTLHDNTVLALGMVSLAWLVALPALVWVRARCEGAGDGTSSVGVVSNTNRC